MNVLFLFYSGSPIVPTRFPIPIVIFRPSFPVSLLHLPLAFLIHTPYFHPFCLSTSTTYGKCYASHCLIYTFFYLLTLLSFTSPIPLPVPLLSISNSLIVYLVSVVILTLLMNFMHSHIYPPLIPFPFLSPSFPSRYLLLLCFLTLPGSPYWRC